MMASSAEIIRALGLEQTQNPIHPGREIFRSIVKTEASKPRRAASSSLFLLQPQTGESRWYQLRTDEILSYHAGIPLKLQLIHVDGSWEERVVGPDILSGEIPQCVVPGWTWRRIVLLDDSVSDAWGLFGSCVVPGFDPADCTTASQSEMERKYQEIFEEIRGQSML